MTAAGASSSRVEKLQPVAPYALRPMEVGELLDEGFDLFRRNFRLLFGIMALVYLPATVLQVSLRGAGDTGWLPDVIALLVAFPAFYALTRAALERHLGREISIAGAYLHTLKQGWRWLLGSVVFALVYGGLLLLLLLPGLTAQASNPILASVLIAMGVLLFLIPAFFLGLWAMLLMPVIAIESRGAGALFRSAQLAVGYLWRLFFVQMGLTLVILVYLTVLAGLTALVYALTGTNALEPPDRANPAAITAYAVLLLVDALIQCAWLPVIATTYLLAYLDIRIRREAYDLELLTGGVEGRVAARAAMRVPSGRPMGHMSADGGAP